MEDTKEIKVRLSTIIIILLLVVVCVLAYLFLKVRNDYNQLVADTENLRFSTNIEAPNQEESISSVANNDSLEDILDKVNISSKFVMASDKYYKQLFVSCNNTTAMVNKEGNLEVTIDGEKSIVQGIEGEIIDLKLGIVNQHDGKEDINTSFVRDVFALTKEGKVYAVNITYGYREDLVSLILSDVVKIENVERYGLYDEAQSLGDSVVIAKKIDNTVAICDDGERDGF